MSSHIPATGHQILVFPYEKPHSTGLISVPETTTQVAQRQIPETISERSEVVKNRTWVRQNPWLFTALLLLALTAIGVAVYFGMRSEGSESVKKCVEAHRDHFLIGGGSVWGVYGLSLLIKKIKEKRKEEAARVDPDEYSQKTSGIPCLCSALRCCQERGL